MLHDGRGGDQQQPAGGQVRDAEGLLPGLAAHGRERAVTVFLVVQQLAQGYAEHLVHRAVRLRIARKGLGIEHLAVGLHHEGDDRLLAAERHIRRPSDPQAGKDRVGRQQQQQRQHENPQGDRKRRRFLIAAAAESRRRLACLLAVLGGCRQTAGLLQSRINACA